MSRDASPMDEIASEGCRIRVRLDGPETKPALVLAHMLGTDLSLWDALVPELARHFRIIRLDARGHGGSEGGAEGFGIGRLGRDVLAVLDHLGIARAHFCGLSMGGAVGLWLLAHAGHRIERAVIAGAAAKLGTPEVWNGRIAAARSQGMEQAVAPTLERWFRPDFAEREPDKIEAVARLIRATSAEGYASCCAALRDMDLREAMRGVTHPVLILRGADDPAVSDDDTRALAEAMENATAHELASSHCACVEDEAGFQATIVRFLTAKTTTRRSPARRVATQRKASEGTAAKPGARRLGGRSTAARRPVARTAPASKKAVAKAGATRKAAARKPTARAEPVRSRATKRPVTAPGRAAPTRAVAPKAASRKAISTKAASRKATAKPTKAATKPVKAAAKPASKASKPTVAKAAATKPAAVPAKSASRKPVARPAAPKTVAAKAASAKTARTAARPKTVAAKPAAKATRTAAAKPAPRKSAKAAAKGAKAKASAAQLQARRGASTGRRKP